MHICPRCNARFSSNIHNTDFVHECNGSSSTLNNEDVVKVGDWEDYTGSGKIQTSDLRFAGAVNKLQGSRAGIYGAKVGQFTGRGKRKETNRTRQHLEYIDLR